MNNKRRRFFITSTLAPEVVDNYKLSVATSNFSFNLASGGAFDKVYSILPDTFGGVLKDEIINNTRYEVVYCTRLRKCDRFFRVLAVLIEQVRLFSIIPRDSSVWFYNLGDLGFLFFILIKLFKRSVLLNVIVLDYTPPVSIWERNRFYVRLINRANGIISLSTSSVFKCKNKAILAGVVPHSTGEFPRIDKVNKKFILSGMLSEVIAQISMVLESFSRLTECELHITGFAKDDTIIRQYAEKYSNIFYHGRVSYADYLNILHDCSYQLSTRDENAPENNCNFPSKVMESLLHNRIVVTTIDYPQLGDVKYLKISSGVASFVDGIRSILEKPQEILKEYANQSLKVKEMFSPEVWQQTMETIESYQEKNDNI